MTQKKKKISKGKVSGKASKHEDLAPSEVPSDFHEDEAILEDTSGLFQLEPLEDLTLFPEDDFEEEEASLPSLSKASVASAGGRPSMPPPIPTRKSMAVKPNMISKAHKKPLFTAKSSEPKQQESSIPSLSDLVTSDKPARQRAESPSAEAPVPQTELSAVLEVPEESTITIDLSEMDESGLPISDSASNPPKSQPVASSRPSRKDVTLASRLGIKSLTREIPRPFSDRSLKTEEPKPLFTKRPSQPPEPQRSVQRSTTPIEIPQPRLPAMPPLDPGTTEPPMAPPRLPQSRKSERRPAAIVEIARKIEASQKERRFAEPDSNTVPRAIALIESCEEELHLTQDKLRASRLHFEVGQVYELTLDDSARALKHYQKSIELGPQFLPAIRGARRLLIHQKAYTEATNLFDAEIRVAGNPKHKAALHLEKGRVLEDLLHQQRKAHQSYLKAATLEEGRPDVLEALKQVEYAVKNWPDLAHVYEKAANAVATDKNYRAALIMQRGRIFDTRLREIPRALEQYLTALEIDPRSSGALPALKRLLYGQSRWRDLILLLETEAESLEEPEWKGAAWLQISRIYSERLGDRDRAVQALERTIALTPDNALALKEIARHYEAQSNYQGLLETLKRLVATIAAPEEKLGYLHRLGQLYEQEMRDPVAAMSWYETALKISHAYIPALRALGELYVQHQRWEPLIRMHLAESETTSDTLRRADACVRVAEILDFHLGKPEEAALYHTRALGFRPGLASSFKALTRIYAESRQYQKLIELYEQAADQATDVDVVFAHLFKVGSLYEDAVHMPDLAMQAYLRILKRAPSNLGAIHALQRAAESAGQYRELVDALKRESDLSKDKTRNIGLLQRAAEVLDEKLDDAESALLYYNKVLDMDPGYPPALSGMGRLYNRMGRWDDLLDIYERELRVTEQSEAKVALLTKMGELAEHQLGNKEAAIKYMQRAIALNANYQPALQSLTQLLREKGDFEALVEVIKTELAGLEDLQSRSHLACQLAEVHEIYRKDLGAAAAAYAESLAALPSYRPALDGISRVNAALGKWQELADQLMSEAGQSRDVQHVANMLLQAGTIYSDYLNDAKTAIQAFERILEAQPLHVGALIALAPLYRETGAWQRLGEVYVRLSNALSDDREKIAVLGELARVLEIYHPNLDVDILNVEKAIVALEPSNITALSEMERLAFSSKDLNLLTEVDTHLVQAMDDPYVAAVYLARLGQSFENTDDAIAAMACNEALVMDPNSLSAIRVLERLAEKTSSAAKLAEAYRREAEWTEKAESAADLFVKSAGIHLDNLEDLEAAVAHLQAALERCPDHVEAASMLVRLLIKTRRIDLLIDILSRTASMARDTARKSELLQMVSSLYSDAKGDLTGAVSAVARMLQAQPNHVPTMTRLIELYKVNNQWEDAAKLLERLIKLSPRGPVLVEACLDLAKICEKQLRNHARALQQIEALLQIDPNHEEALTILCDLQFKLGKLDAANQAAERLYKSSVDPKVRALALFCVGRIKVKKGARRNAAKFLREAVALAGPSTEAAEEYRRLLGSDEPWSGYAEALTAYQDQIQGMAGERDNMAITIRELARVQHEGEGNPDRAIMTLRQGLSAIGDHPTLQFDLGLRLTAIGRHAEAAGELQRLLVEDPTNAAAWRALTHTYRVQGKQRQASFALAPLVVLEEATPTEQQESEQNLSRPGLAESGSFNLETLFTLSPDAEGETELTAFLCAVNDALGKVYPPDFQVYGLSSRDSLGASSSHPLRQLADTLARVFNVGGFELYIGQSDDHPPTVELTQPASIVAPPYVTNLPVSGQVFVLARLFAYIARGQQAILKLGRQELLQMTAAVSHNSSFGGASFSADTLEHLGKRVVKATSWRGRKSVEEAAQHVASLGHFDVDLCLFSIEATATRAAALLSTSLPLSVAQIRHTDSSLAAQRGKDLVDHSSVIKDLLSFWSSEQAFALCERAGLL